MPVAYNVLSEFDVDIKLSTGHTINLISGENELLIEGENGRLRVNRGKGDKGGLTGKPVDEIDADPKGGMKVDPNFFVGFEGERPHQVRLEGGDASSDSYCYP